MNPSESHACRYVFLASFGCLLSFILLLDAERAFLRSLPIEVWNGWLMLLVLAASLLLLAAGIRGIWGEVSKTTISVSRSAEIFCRCPQCGHEWTFPAEHLRTLAVSDDHEPPTATWWFASSSFRNGPWISFSLSEAP